MTVKIIIRVIAELAVYVIIRNAKGCVPWASILLIMGPLVNAPNAWNVKYPVITMQSRLI